jgi:hypothetical protein
VLPEPEERRDRRFETLSRGGAVKVNYVIRF